MVTVKLYATRQGFANVSLLNSIIKDDDGNVVLVVGNSVHHTTYSTDIDAVAAEIAELDNSDDSIAINVHGSPVIEIPNNLDSESKTD